MLSLLSLLTLAQVSSPIGEGVCVQLVAAFDPRSMVGESVEGIGGYCSLSGCQITGPVAIITSGRALRLPTAGSYIEFAGGPRINGVSSSRLDIYVSNSLNISSAVGGEITTLNVLAATSAFSSLVTAANVTSAGYVKSTGVATGSLPTCNAGLAGAFEWDTTVSCMKLCDGSSWRCVSAGDGGSAVTSSTIVTLGHATTPTGAIDSTVNTQLLGQYTQATVRYLTGGIATPGTGSGTTIQFECTGVISGKRCLADIDCDNSGNGFDGGTFFTVPFFAYSGAGACSFSNDIVRCLGRNSPVDGGTDCTLDPVLLINDLAIEGTYP